MYLTSITEKQVGRRLEDHRKMKPIQITSTLGTEDGQSPAHLCHDVSVTIARSNSVCWAVRIRETCGSSQVDNEERGCREIFGAGESLVEAVQEASRRSEAAGIAKSYLGQALSNAEAKATAKVQEAERSPAIAPTFPKSPRNNCLPRSVRAESPQSPEREQKNHHKPNEVNHL